MGKNGYLERRKVRDTVMQDAIRQTYQQYMTDMLILTLNDPEVMGEGCLRLQAAEEGAGRLGQELRQVFRRAHEEAGGGLCQGED